MHQFKRAIERHELSQDRGSPQECADRRALKAVTSRTASVMKEAIRQRALELGFDDCRFTTAAAPASADQFQNWLAGKQHGEMAWLERNAPKRIDPQKVLPGAKSVICLAASYEISTQ